MKALLKVNKKDGFDCQSCAWPSPDEHRQVAEFCENGAKAIADEGTTKRVTPEFFREHSLEFLREQSDHWLGQQGRLTQPMVKREGATHYEPISWEDAFALVGKELNALPTPDAASFYTSGRTSNEAAFLYQLFVRQFGTNNLPDCSNMCHESSGEALGEAIGVGKGCVKLEDFDEADAIFIVGQNPGTNHPRMLSSLQSAKRKGAKIVSINPMPEVGNFRFKNPQDMKNPLRVPGFFLGKGTELSDLWLPLRINGDVAVFKGMMKEMLAAEDARPGTVFDQDFIREYTAGYEEFIADLRATSWDDILVGSGLTREQIRAAAEIAMQSKRIICCWAMGLTQHKNAVGTLQTILNFLLLGGNIGRPGAGPCPVRGHSNVQGDRTMGIWERMSEAFLQKLGDEFHFTPPREHGHDVVETIKEMHRGHIRVFVGDGREFSLGLARYRIHREGVESVSADGTCRDQVEPLASRHRRDRADSAVPRSFGDRSAGERRAVRDGGGFDGNHQSLARRAGTGERTSAERARDHRGPGEGDAGRPDDGGLGRAGWRLQPHPRSHRSRHPGLRAVSTNASRRTSSICRTTRGIIASLTTRSAKRSSRCIPFRGTNCRRAVTS